MTKSKGFRISQLFSSKVDPGEILNEYRTTRFPDRFYNLKIGIPRADLQRRVDAASVLALCADTPPLEKSEEPCSMGVDTGRAPSRHLREMNTHAGSRSRFSASKRASASSSPTSAGQP